MSRVFNGSAANFLSHDTFDLASTIEEFTTGSWIKLNAIGTSGVISCFGPSGASVARMWMEISSGGNPRVFADNAYSSAANPIDAGAWYLLVHRRVSNGLGQYIHELILGDQVVATSDPVDASAAGSALLTNRADVHLGQTTSGTSAFNGKLAHYFTFLRPLSNAEITLLAGGDNPDTLTATGRREYYPLTGSSLDNLWAEDIAENPPALTMTGTVATDDADNPTVDAVVLPATVSLAANPQLGATLSGTYASFGGTPTGPIQFDQGARSLPDEAITVDAGAGTWVTDTALPGLPVNGASVTPFPLIGTDIDITLPDPGV